MRAVHIAEKEETLSISKGIDSARESARTIYVLYRERRGGI